MISAGYASEMLIGQFVPTGLNDARAYAARLNKQCGCPDLVKYVIREDEYGWHQVWRVPR